MGRRLVTLTLLVLALAVIAQPDGPAKRDPAPAATSVDLGR